jgi:hypothetical protein
MVGTYRLKQSNGKLRGQCLVTAAAIILVVGTSLSSLSIWIWWQSDAAYRSLRRAGIAINGNDDENAEKLAQDAMNWLSNHAFPREIIGRVKLNGGEFDAAIGNLEIAKKILTEEVMEQNFTSTGRRSPQDQREYQTHLVGTLRSLSEAYKNRGQEGDDKIATDLDVHAKQVEAGTFGRRDR